MKIERNEAIRLIASQKLDISNHIDHHIEGTRLTDQAMLHKPGTKAIPEATSRTTTETTIDERNRTSTSPTTNEKTLRMSSAITATKWDIMRINAQRNQLDPKHNQLGSNLLTNGNHSSDLPQRTSSQKISQHQTAFWIKDLNTW